MAELVVEIVLDKVGESVWGVCNVCALFVRRIFGCWEIWACDGSWVGVGVVWMVGVTVE